MCGGRSSNCDVLLLPLHLTNNKQATTLGHLGHEWIWMSMLKSLTFSVFL